MEWENLLDFMTSSVSYLSQEDSELFRAFRASLVSTYNWFTSCPTLSLFELDQEHQAEAIPPQSPQFLTVLSQLGLCKLFLPSNRSNSWWNMVRMVWRLWKFCIHPPKAMPCTSEQRAELWWSCSCGTLNGRHGLREAAQDGYETQVTDARQKNNKWTQQINQIMLYDMSYPIPLESSSIPIPWLILPQNPNVCWLNPR